MFTSPQNLYVEGLPPDVMELGGGALRGGGYFLSKRLSLDPESATTFRSVFL